MLKQIVTAKHYIMGLKTLFFLEIRDIPSRAGYQCVISMTHASKDSIWDTKDHNGTSLWQWLSSIAFNSSDPGKFEWNFRYVILVFHGWSISCEIALIWMSLYFTDDQWTLVHVMAWCRQATRHCLSQWWPRSLLLCGVTRPQWVNLWALGDMLVL